MRLTRIKRIKGHGIFRDFAWPADLQPFAQFNLIYGWNASGKTTLSSLLRHLQTRSDIAVGEVEFEIDTAKIAGDSLQTAQLPAVRVFNRDFIASTILAAAGQMDPIYYLGADSVEKQKQVEKLKQDLAQAETEVTRAGTGKSRAERALDDFCISKAKVIKEILLSPRSTRYSNYDKRPYKQIIEQLDEKSAAAASLSDDAKERLRKQKDSQPKEVIPRVAIAISDFDGLSSEAEALLKRSVVSQVLSELVVDREVSAWVQTGIALHSGDRKSATCRFCDQPLRATRLHKLEAHFNDVFIAYQVEVTELAARVDGQRRVLVDAQFPESSRLYDYLVTEIQSSVTGARRLLEAAAVCLDSMHVVLLRKREAPFESIPLESALSTGARPERAALLNAIEAVNAVIDKHNTTTNDFHNQVETACKSLEQGYIAEGFAEYRQLSNAVNVAVVALQSVNAKPGKLRAEIAAIELEIVEHRRPAEELNAELRSYLGRDELRLEVKERGYTMRRRGEPANDLSEGEKTAIAFLYFLKSLHDKSFDLSNGVVVVDDPVSSLDANALFSAFGYMKERTKTAGQLFVMTHNFGFFRQVKNWFHHLPNQNKKDPDLRPGRFFMLNTSIRAGERTASLAPLDPLLEQFESEYHYLFKRVHAEASSDDAGVMLEEYYGMPNMARRLVEAFLAFRFPSGSSDLSKKFDQVDFDAGKKTRILRFLHTYSHSGSIMDPEHDPSVLAETKSVLRDLLELIKQSDAGHYAGMVAMVGAVDPETDAQ